MAYNSQIDITRWPVFGFDAEEKAKTFNAELWNLTKFHQNNNSAYRALINKFSADNNTPFPLPVRLFKLHELVSVAPSDVVKTMTSSGTSGQQVSKIMLDKQTASLQVMVLSKIVTDFIGSKRLPMLVIDCPSTLKNRLKFSARTAGILGFSIFGRNMTFALNDDMSINTQAIQSFLEKHQQQSILLFGFTFIVWLHFIQALQQQKNLFDLSKGILIHGGGWKKIAQQAVSKADFKQHLTHVCGIKKVYNYYGMVEQTGSIFMECDYGHFHTSVWADILIRDQLSHQVLANNQLGLIQLMSLIPRSYPGHSILTEDLGIILGEDDCPCGRKGKYFDVLGRLEQAEIRGCSDTYSR